MRHGTANIFQLPAAQPRLEKIINQIERFFQSETFIGTGLEIRRGDERKQQSAR